MADFIIKIKDKNNALLKEVVTPLPYLDTASVGSTINIDCRERGYIEQHAGTYKTKMQAEVTPNPNPTPTPTPDPTPIPIPTPTPLPGTLLYDSNVDIDWAAMNGKTIEIDKPYGNPKIPNSKYIRMNASGSPKITFNAATKEMVLQHSGSYGRAYFGVCNYQSRLELEFMLDSCNNNCSLKTRNRHQYNEYLRSIGQPEISRPEGGQGCSIHCNETDADLEVYHGSEVGGPSASISPQLTAGKYYKVRFSQFDQNGKIHVYTDLDRGDGQGFKKIVEGDVNAPSQFFDKAKFENWSEFWIRLNASNGGKLTFKNVKMYAL